MRHGTWTIKVERGVKLDRNDKIYMIRWTCGFSVKESRLSKIKRRSRRVDEIETSKFSD